ncbi:MAG TPA: MHYT domain-containing protein, partial [Bryobacteraceae bacterium]|nr:MHYT domain-containing protein [Bryobacteraceae bacterium]
MTGLGSPITGSYDYGLVALSILIAVLASYAALDLAGRVASTKNVARIAWLIGGAAAMGTGIWSMHYVGMLALKLPFPVEYDWPTVLMSLLAAIMAAATALFIISRGKMGFARAGAGSLLMGGGIAGMHYIGMAAMRIPACCEYSTLLVTASVLIAVGVSFAALRLTFRFSGHAAPGGVAKVLSAIVMGAAISSMHYTGMAAVSFRASANERESLRHALSISALGVAGIAAVTLLLLAFTVIVSVLDRRFSAQVFHSNELLPLLLESAPEAIYGVDTKGECIICNNAFLRMTGYGSAHEVMGRNVHDLIHHTRPDGTPFPPAECEIFRSFRIGQETHIADELLWRKDGTSFSAECWSRPIVRAGQIIGSVITFIDITERKRAQEHLLESETKHRALFEASADAILLMDDSGFVDCNAAALQMFGYANREEMFKPHPGDFSPPQQPGGMPSRQVAD